MAFLVRLLDGEPLEIVGADDGGGKKEKKPLILRRRTIDAGGGRSNVSLARPPTSV